MLPACEAVMTHAPAPAIVTAPALVTVQTVLVVLANVTARLELAFARLATLKPGSPNFLLSADASKVIVWVALITFSDTVVTGTLL